VAGLISFDDDSYIYIEDLESRVIEYRLCFAHKLIRIGTHFGAFPVTHLVWRIYARYRRLADFLAIANCAFFSWQQIKVVQLL